MVTVTGIQRYLQDLEEMSSRLTLTETGDEEIVLESEYVTATLRMENGKEGELELEYMDLGIGETEVEVYLVPDDIKTVSIYQEDDTPRLVVNQHDYGF